MIADLAEVKAVDVAAVFKGDIQAGRLRRMADHVQFAYERGYVREGGCGVAWSLPIRREPLPKRRGAPCPPSSLGYCPKGLGCWRLFETSRPRPTMSCLCCWRWRGTAIGDVTVVPVGEQPRDPGESSGVQSPGDVSFRELFARSVSGTDPLFDTAIPGVQDKLSDALVSFPVDVGGGSAILKLTPRRYPRLVENEAFFLAMAAACGFQVSPFRVVHDRGGESGLLVERLDRVSDTGRVTRIAQEDACQLAGLWPADKYRLSMRAVIRRVASVVSSPKVAALELVRLTAFSYLIVNGDMHAKNISVRWLPSELIVEPTPVIRPGVHPALPTGRPSRPARRRSCQPYARP